MKSGFALAIWLLAAPLLAADGFPRVPATPPDKAEATFETLLGFRMKLIAAEPLVASPVDLAYDEDGRAYVVEMRDYPYPEEKNAAPTNFPGTVRLLEDQNGDGQFDKATIFADRLAWPTSVCCYQGGVFVAAAPDIWYFKDTNGDGQADVRRKVFTGFSRYNVQAIMNSLRWGLDNRIYGAAAGNGGNIRHAERPADPLLALARRDFRFDPVTEKVEAVSGGERFGASFDDWGNRFLCNIRNPVQHVVLPLEYLQRNPHLVAPSAVHDCAEAGDQLRVFRLSPPEAWREFRAQRWALEQANLPRSETIGAGFWTSSSGVCVYRGAAYPEPFRDNVFIGEVAGNLVHRQVLSRDGVTFKSKRADENTEFVRSRDNWFRPVNFVNAPDGTLTLLDMYRETIEHPWSIPDDIKAQLDLTSGKERGRLYRLAPPQFAVPKPPKLSTATAIQLVAYLESPHSWYRETAQRLLLERQDKSAADPLLRLLETSASPQARLHAAYTLAGLRLLTETSVIRLLADSHGKVRRHALLLAEPLLKGSNGMQQAVVRLTNDEDPGVQFQLALTAGNLPGEHALPVLRSLAFRHADDRWLRVAIVSSSSPVIERLVQFAIQDIKVEGWATPDRRALIRELTAALGAEGRPAAVESALSATAPCELPGVYCAALTGLGQGLARRREKLSDRIARLPADIRRKVESQLDEAATRAALGHPLDPARADAIGLLAFRDWSAARSTLASCLAPSQQAAVQQSALRTLASFNEATAADDLLRSWKQLTPPIREEAFNVLLSRPLWHESLLSALEKGDILVSQLTIPQRTRLAAMKDAALAPRAAHVLGSFALSPRNEAIEKYQPALALAGDGRRGQVVYRRECASCHRLAREGHDVGPSLETIQHRSPQEILIHVLDPNREVSPQFLDYTVRLTDGRVLTGLIAAENDAGLTLRRAQKQEDTVLRSEIDEIATSGKSLMPEGLEQKLTPQEVADLIAHLRAAGPRS